MKVTRISRSKLYTRDNINLTSIQFGFSSGWQLSNLTFTMAYDWNNFKDLLWAVHIFWASGIINYSRYTYGVIILILFTVYIIWKLYIELSCRYQHLKNKRTLRSVTQTSMCRIKGTSHKAYVTRIKLNPYRKNDKWMNKERLMWYILGNHHLGIEFFVWIWQLINKVTVHWNDSIWFHDVECWKKCLFK